MAKRASTGVIDPATREQVLAALSERYKDPRAEMAAIEREGEKRNKAVDLFVKQLNKDQAAQAAFMANPLGAMHDLLGPYDRIVVELDPLPTKFKIPKLECHYEQTWEERWILINGEWHLVYIRRFKRVCVWIYRK